MWCRAVIAYLQAMRGDVTQAAQLDVKEAEVMMEDMIKQAGKGPAAPRPQTVIQPNPVQHQAHVK